MGEDARMSDTDIQKLIEDLGSKAGSARHGARRTSRPADFAAKGGS